MILPYLRMHRAGPHGSLRRIFLLDRWAIAQPALRIGDEFLAAMAAAEMEFLPGVVGVMRGCRRIDGHPADRVDSLGDAVFGVRICTMAMVATIVILHRRFSLADDTYEP